MIEIDCPQCDGRGWVTVCANCHADEEFCVCGDHDPEDRTCWRCDGKGHIVGESDAP